MSETKINWIKMQVQAKDVKPGDRIWGKINDNITLAECKVYMVNQTIDNVTITSVHGKTYRVQPDLYFIREVSPAEEKEIDESISTGYEADIERIDQEIKDCAFSILDRIEMHIKDLIALRDGGQSYQELDSGTFGTIGDDFKQAAETAIDLQNLAGDSEALRDEMMEQDISHDADEGPHGRNK